MIKNKKSKKNCIYTVIIGGYDNLHTPKIFSKKYDYICFTDDPTITKSKYGWDIRYIDTTSTQNSRLIQRGLKIFNDYIFNNYDKSIYIDGNININFDLSSFDIDRIKEDIVFLSHSKNCVHKEAKGCIDLKKDYDSNIMEQVYHYKRMGLKENIGLFATGLMVRKHTQKVKSFCTDWSKEVCQWSLRDQISLPYVLAFKKHSELSVGILPFSILDNLFLKKPHIK